MSCVSKSIDDTSLLYADVLSELAMVGDGVPMHFVSLSSYAGPSAWNSLPQHIREITDTTRFKRHLKTVLFQRAFLDF